MQCTVLYTQGSYSLAARSAVEGVVFSTFRTSFWLAALNIAATLAPLRLVGLSSVLESSDLCDPVDGCFCGIDSRFEDNSNEVLTSGASP